MEFYETVRKRLSVRSYTNRPIEPDKLTRILEATRLAPSGKNTQPWHFILVTDESLKRKMVPMLKGQSFVADAPIIIVLCGNPEIAHHLQGNFMNAMPIDVAIAFEHLILAATSEGLGTCWIGAFFEDQVRELLEIPAPWRVIALTPLGYPLKEGRPQSRKELAEIISYDMWKV
jgi:nitroreductase